MEPNTTLPKTPKVKEYIAIINQLGGNAPTAIILKNNIGGTPVWSRTSTGQYILTLAGAFPINNTLVTWGAQSNAFIWGGPVDTPGGIADEIYLNTRDATNVYSDSRLYQTPFKIQIYNI